MRRLVLVAALASALCAGPARGAEPPTAEAVERALQGTFADPALRDGLARSHVEASTPEEVLRTGTIAMFRSLMAWMQDVMKNNPLLGGLLWFVLIGTLIPLLLHLGWSLRLAFTRRAPRARRPGEVDDDAAGRARRSAELRGEARALAAAGRLQDAARALLLAFLALLDERQALVVAGSWTNREVLARLRVLPPGVRERLARFVEAADAACYGRQGPSREALAQGEELLLELERGALPGERP